MKRYQDWARRSYSTRQRIVTLFFAGLLFLFLLPYLLVAGSGSIDSALQLPRFYHGAVNWISGGLLVLAGGFLALWSIEAQMTIGSGTPLPMMPTQRLVVRAPFTYCRNPMTLGTVIAYLGIGVLIGSYSEMVIVVLFGALLVLYVKFIEEKELQARFGEDYLAYKRKTPFLFPRFWKRS